MNTLEMLNMLQGKTKNENELLEKLSYIGEPPGEDFSPTISLPNIEGLPSFNVSNNGVGANILDMLHAEPAPMFGQSGNVPESIGSLILGENTNA